MHPAKKGNTWDFGMKMHIGVDDELGLTQSLSTRAANISDVTRAADLLHGDEQRVCGDSGYQGGREASRASGS
jgi:transposase, IS5 family